MGTQAAGHQESFMWDIGASLEIGPIAQSEWEKQWGTCVGLKGFTASTSILFARILTWPCPMAGEDVSAGK